MAVYDHRTFRHQANWWVAQVHGQSGSGWGAGPHSMTDEFVLFTSLTAEESKSRSAHIPIGKLNAMNHRSIVRFLEVAEEFPSRVEMAPYNTPDETEYADAEKVVDDEELRWALRQLGVPTSNRERGPDAVLEVVCLDDSALRRDIFLQWRSTYDDFQLSFQDRAAYELVVSVKATFEELFPDEIQMRGMRYRAPDV